jgi:PIN domain nuclease of toxin-antitoxin system
MSEVILLDTHIWLWYVNGNFDRIPEHWLDQIEGADQVGISPLSCYEIALANQRGRLELHDTADRWFQDALEPIGIILFPVTAAISVRAVNLSPLHRDPFDRLIIATALSYDARLASVDSLFPQYLELQGCLMM